MKKKRSLFIAGLLAIVLVLGVGYAVVNGVILEISGDAAAKTEELNVYFTDATEVSSEKVIATAENEALTASIDVNDLVLGEKVTATYTIKNGESDVNAVISKNNITNSKEEFFKVTTDVDSSTKTIESGSTDTVTVTVELIKTPIEIADSTATIEVQLAAEPGSN